MKVLYHIWHIILKLRAKLSKKMLVNIGKDYFIYHDRVIELRWLTSVKMFSYNKTVQFLTWSKFYINNESVIDIDNGIKVLHHNIELRKNSFGFIIDNKQYNWLLELMDEWEVYSVMYNLLVTKTKVKKWVIYKVINPDKEVIHQFPVSNSLLYWRKDWDYIVYDLGKNTKKIHIGWFKEIIEEI